MKSLIENAGSGDIQIDLNVWASIGVAAVAGGVMSLISFVRNALEDTTGKTLLK